MDSQDPSFWTQIMHTHPNISKAQSCPCSGVCPDSHQCRAHTSPVWIALHGQEKDLAFCQPVMLHCPTARFPVGSFHFCLSSYKVKSSNEETERKGIWILISLPLLVNLPSIALLGWSMVSF